MGQSRFDRSKTGLSRFDHHFDHYDMIDQNERTL